MWKEKESKTIWSVGLITWDLIREQNAGNKEISMNYEKICQTYSWRDELMGGQHESLFLVFLFYILSNGTTMIPK